MESLRKRVVVGLAAGAAAGLAMNTFARMMNAATRGREAAGAARGLRRVGRGMQPPQALGAAEDDAAVRMGSLAYEGVTGRRPDMPRKLALGAIAHYAFSMGTAVLYAAAAERWPAIRRGFGTLYGLAVWAAADEGLVPALGLSRGPRQIPPALHAYSIVGHAIYGATVEAVTQLGSSTPRTSLAARGAPGSRREPGARPAGVLTAPARGALLPRTPAMRRRAERD